MCVSLLLCCIWMLPLDLLVVAVVVGGFHGCFRLFYLRMGLGKMTRSFIL